MQGTHVHCIKGALELAEDFADKIYAYRPLQFDNKLNNESQYKTTGKEIIDAILEVNTFVSESKPVKN